MFTKLTRTNFPPSERPLMVFDGNCGFCKYWVVKWKKISRLEVEYQPYQRAAEYFKDIEEQHFKQAVRYIAVDGTIYNGPDAAYITYYNQGKVMFLHRWYLEKPWFQKLSDVVYQWVADHRNLMSRISVRLFGKNPANPKPYWKWYLLGLMVLVVTLIVVSSTSI